MKSISKYILLAALAICLIGVVLYHVPVHVEKTVTMINSDGNTIELSADVVFQRSLIRPTSIKGTIMLDGTQYRDLESVLTELPGKYSTSYTWWDAFVDKWNGTGANARFAYSDAADSVEANSHQIILFEIGPGFSLDKIEMMFLDGESDASEHVVGVYYWVKSE